MAPVRLDDAALRRARLMAEVGPLPIRPQRGGSAFAYLTRAILAQQISVAAARSIANRIKARFGWPLRPEHVTGAGDAELRALGLSRQKAAYLRDLAAHTRDGLPLDRLSRLPDERVIEALTVVKGIGRWTAEMYLMFRLGRPDVLPVDDLGIRTAMRRVNRMRGMPKKDRMCRIAEPWRPYRTVACLYLWRSLDAAKGPPPKRPRAR
jgi:3-methyladenine DNA glycosylase/8-oxoguanine DNA glycosylase